MSDTTHDVQLRNAFNRWSACYEQEVEQKLIDRWYSYDKLAALIAAWCEGASALFEIGCGPGTLGKRVKDRLPAHVQLRALDVSDEMVKLATATGRYDSVDRASADKYSFSADTEVIFTAFVLHSVEDIDAMLGRVLDLPKLSQVIVIDLFPRNAEVARTSAEHSALHEFGAPERYVTIDEFKAQLQRHPLRITASGLLGKEKDYVHGYFVVEKESH